MDRCPIVPLTKGWDSGTIWIVADIAAQPVQRPVNGTQIIEAKFPSNQIQHVAVVAGGEVIPFAALRAGDMQSETATLTPPQFLLGRHSPVRFTEQVQAHALAVGVQAGSDLGDAVGHSVASPDALPVGKNSAAKLEGGPSPGFRRRWGASGYRRRHRSILADPVIQFAR